MYFVIIVNFLAKVLISVAGFVLFDILSVADVIIYVTVNILALYGVYAVCVSINKKYKLALLNCLNWFIVRKKGTTCGHILFW